MSFLSDYASEGRTARVMLSLIAEPDDASLGALIRRVGAGDALRLLDSGDQTSALPPDRAAVLHGRAQMLSGDRGAEARIREVLDGRFVTVMPGDDHWPAALDDLGDRAPLLLWARGATSLLSGGLDDRVTMTGSRASTPYGDQVANEIAGDLADREITLVSGGAYGIDGQVHKSALARGGHTIAVLPAGIDRPYPYGHKELFDRIGEVGLLVSELAPGAAPSRWRFMARSRLLAAMSTTTVIVEAGYRSGTLMVADQAQALGRTVGAVPGPVTSAASSGAHRLLQQGMASLVTHAGDVVELAGRAGTPQEAPARQLSHDAAQAAATKDEPRRAL
ncbi:DNA processing protein [Brevibacterium aurantiacum]|uniref:DNA processing protein n=1 Tax=Brevibacterium aurantiacum TaxID=273384 RepID=A0A2H1JJT7_BREAU|nr:DNA-processing protein DprA [Brevibacterium aurantiacum]SMX87719.1 DNA processing protein [Brevibacterium aurantiacum]